MRPKQLKHLQHTPKTLAKHQKKLETMCVANANIANIQMKKHLHIICNIHIYFCNIQM
jgi:hypothetical protein